MIRLGLRGLMLGSGGGPGITPRSMSGLQLWLDAGKGTYQDVAKTVPAAANADPVQLWADQSGQGTTCSKRRPARFRRWGLPS